MKHIIMYALKCRTLGAMSSRHCGQILLGGMANGINSQPEMIALFHYHIWYIRLVECYALLVSAECARKIRSTYNVTVCAVPVRKIGLLTRLGGLAMLTNNAHAHFLQENGRLYLWHSMEGVLDLCNRAVSEKPPHIFGPTLPTEYVTVFSRQTDAPEVRCGLTDTHTQTQLL